ncbi:MAG: TolC family protein [Gemmataceae bacterium]|jgi:hypothetical protein|nr:TolC family protein [Gemmataceae bacterium]
MRFSLAMFLPIAVVSSTFSQDMVPMLPPVPRTPEIPIVPMALPEAPKVESKTDIPALPKSPKENLSLPEVPKEPKMGLPVLPDVPKENLNKELPPVPKLLPVPENPDKPKDRQEKKDPQEKKGDLEPTIPPAKDLNPKGVPPKDVLPDATPIAPVDIMPFPAPIVISEEIRRLTLSDCLAFAREKQPVLIALRASMNRALLATQGLADVKRKGGFILPDLEYRQQQSANGLKAARVELEQAEYEIAYAVTYSYYTIVYAKEQRKVALELIEQLEIYLDQVKKIVGGKGGGIKEINKNTENFLELALNEAKIRLQDAERGISRGRAALKEAMGYTGPERIDAADELLPDVVAKIPEDVVIAHALSRRGEIMLTAIGADTCRLEVCAQWSRMFTSRLATFANGGDIHSKSLPTTTYEPTYRPGAIGLDVPDKLLGDRSTRTRSAQMIAARAEAVHEKAKNLVTLEATTAYIDWVRAKEKVALARQGVKAAKEMQERQREATGGNFTKSEILTTEASVTKAQVSLNEALYDQIIALATLERVTAGGIRLNLPVSTTPIPKPVPAPAPTPIPSPSPSPR